MAAALLFTACGGDEGGSSAPSSAPPPDVTSSNIAESYASAPPPAAPDLRPGALSVIAAVTDKEMIEVPQEVAYLNYNLGPESADLFIQYVETTGAITDEVMIARAVSEDKIDKIKEGIAFRIAAQKKSFGDGYDVTGLELPKLDTAVTVVEGRYVLFVVSGNPRAGEAIFRAWVAGL